MPAAGSRPEPTEAHRNTVRGMASQGFAHETIALCLAKKGIDPKTMRNNFRRELDTGVAIPNANIGTIAYQAAMRGGAWACCFWLKCRGGCREKIELEHSVPKDNELRIEVRTLEGPPGL